MLDMNVVGLTVAKVTVEVPLLVWKMEHWYWLESSAGDSDAPMRGNLEYMQTPLT